MMLTWQDEELVSKGFRGKRHVATLAISENLTRGELASLNRWFWSTWDGNFRLAQGVADSREDAKIGAVRIGLHPRLRRT